MTRVFDSARRVASPARAVRNVARVLHQGVAQLCRGGTIFEMLMIGKATLKKVEIFAEGVQKDEGVECEVGVIGKEGYVNKQVVLQNGFTTVNLSGVLTHRGDKVMVSLLWPSAESGNELAPLLIDKVFVSVVAE